MSRNAWLFVVVGLVVFILVAGNRTNAPVVERPATKTVSADPEPVSAECRKAAEDAERLRLVTPGGMDATGATLHTSAAWARMPFDSQRGLAECLSHYIAGGQDRWIKRIQFRNQATGVIYGVIENTRYRSGP